MEQLSIKSEPIVIKEGNLLIFQNQELQEGEDLEQSCIKNAKKQNLNVKIVKPLNPFIQWSRNPITNKLNAEVSVNYLAELN